MAATKTRSKASSKAKKKSGRPSTYSATKASAICDRVVNGERLATIYEDENVPRTTFFRWLQEHEGFRDQYVRAREFAMESEMDELLALSDVPSTQDDSFVAIARAKLQVDVRKWRIVKLAPKTYGDRAELEVKETKTYVVRMPDKAESTEAWVERWNSTYSRS